MTESKTILYVQTTDAAEKQYSPLVLAQTAKMMDQKPMVYYLGTGIKILQPEAAKKIQLGSFPPLSDIIQKTIEMDIPIYVCEASKQMLGWEKIKLISGTKIVGAATLNDLALDAHATMWF